MTNNETSGFNLIELLIVIVILAIVISVAVVKYANYSRRVEIASVYSSAKALEAAIIRKINIKDSALSKTDIASFNLNSVRLKNIKYFASINVVDATDPDNPPSTSLPAAVLAEITKSIPISNIIAHAQYDLTDTCRLIANKPAKWFNIFYYLSSNDSTKQQISSTMIGVGVKLDCMPSTYQKTLCPDASYSKGGACVACTPLSGAIKPCSGTSDASCVSGATQIGNYCKCNTGTYWDGTACSPCTPLTGPAGTVQACSDTGDATCIGGTIQTGNTCGCGTNQYWNGSACTTCTALTGPAGSVQHCSGSSDTRCSAGTIKSGNTCVCAGGQYWNGSVCTACPANATCNNNNINCNSGYTLSGNVCIAACPTNCISCTSPTKCTTCQTGYYIKNGACSACPSYATCIDGISFSCYPVGFTRGTDSCTCAAGANIILPGHTGGWSQVSQPMCALCLSGTMSSSINSMNCTTCPANTFAPGPTMQDMGGYYISISGGSTECTPCPPGTHSMPGAAICN